MCKSQPRTASNDPEPQAPASNRNLLDSLYTFAFVIGTAVICIIALHNSLLWHMQQFWGASGDFWDKQYGRIFDWFDGNKYHMALFGVSSLQMFVFVATNLLLTIIDFTEWQPLFKYKIQPKEHVTMRRYMSALGRVMFNQLVIAPPMYLAMYHLSDWRGCEIGPGLPTFHRVLAELVFFVIVEEIGFYYSHRLAHTPYFYKRIHKIHHEWTAPIGIVAQYAHPLEHIFSNLMPVMMGPLLAGSHLATAALWYTMALVSTTISHSGYHFPLLPSPEAHDYHHLVFNQCFGVLGVLDRLHGTDAKFLASQEYKRHYMAVSLTPIRTIVPDVEKKTMLAAKKAK